MSAPVARLAQADLLLLAARLFSPPPADRALFDVDAETLAAMLGAAGMDPAPNGAIGRALEAARIADPEAWRAEHTRLFDGSGACPMNETVHIRRDKGAILADVAGFYRAFGWRAVERGEKLDCLVTELEFAAVLLAMLAEAERAGSPERAEVTLAALRSFFADHLGEWLPLFCERLRETAALGLFLDAAEALEAVFGHVAAEIGVPAPIGPEGAPFLLEEGTPFTCGMAGGEFRPGGRDDIDLV